MSGEAERTSGVAKDALACFSADQEPTSASQEVCRDASSRSIGDEILSLEALLVSRAYLYLLFHKVLGGEPCGRLFEILSDSQTVAIVDEYADADQKMADLRDYLASLTEKTDEEFVDVVKDEFVRSFVGPNRLLALPWESPYVSHEPVLFHKSTLAVRSAYRAHGWRIKRHLHIPDDHVSLICAFMARLSEETLCAFEKGCFAEVRVQMFEQNLFIGEHLVNWIVEYEQGLRASGKAPFYSRIVGGLASFAQLDGAFTAEAVGWLDEQMVSQEVEEGCVAGGCAAALAGSARYFSDVKNALKQLGDLRLKNLEDNELCDID